MSNYLGRKPEPGELLRNKGLTPRDKKPPTPLQKRQADPENDRKHLDDIKSLMCCVKGCGKNADDPHHLKHGIPRGLGIKAKDRYAVPMCRRHHDEVERAGSKNEHQWFAERGILSVIELANGLWAARSYPGKMLKVLFAHWTDWEKNQ